MFESRIDLHALEIVRFTRMVIADLEEGNAGGHLEDQRVEKRVWLVARFLYLGEARCGIGETKQSGFALFCFGSGHALERSPQVDGIR